MPSASAAPLDVLRRCARTDAGGAIGRDTGEGQYPWDLMPDSIMTNATVGKVDQAPQRPVLHLTFKGTNPNTPLARTCRYWPMARAISAS